MKELTEWDFDIPRDNRFEAWPLKEIRNTKIKYEYHTMNYSFNADYREVANRLRMRNIVFWKRFWKWPWC